jgi:hypothetical protein
VSAGCATARGAGTAGKTRDADSLAAEVRTRASRAAGRGVKAGSPEELMATTTMPATAQAEAAVKAVVAKERRI